MIPDMWALMAAATIDEQGRLREAAEGVRSAPTIEDKEADRG